MKVTKKKTQISEKNNKMDFSDMDGFQDPFYLDDALKNELDKKGLVGRFINITRIQQMGGRHQSGWSVYKRESQDPSVYGTDPEGLVRRGADLVLAVKTKEALAKHKAYLKRERDSVSVKRNLGRKKAEMEDYVRRSNVKGLDVVTEDN